MRQLIADDVSIEYVAGTCTNPKCNNEINLAVLRKGNRYCVPCQIILQKIKRLFPRATKSEIRKFFVGEDFTQIRAATLLGIPRGTFKGYRQRGYVTLRRGRKDSYISAEELIRFCEELEDYVLLRDAAKKLKIPYPYFRRMVSRPNIPSYIFLDRLAVRRRDYEMIERTYIKLRNSISSRKGNRAKSTDKVLSIAEIVKILDLLDQGMLYYRIKKGVLVARKRKNRWYVRREDFTQFCWNIVNGTIKTIIHTKTYAKAYLDSIAAG